MVVIVRFFVIVDHHHHHHHHPLFFLKPVLSHSFNTVLHGFEDQYQPDEITLFSKNKAGNEVRINNRDQLHARMTYPFPYGELCGRGKDVCVIVSAMNGEENQLLLTPASWSPSTEIIVRDITKGYKPPLPEKNMKLIRELIDGTKFKPLGLPVHIGGVSLCMCVCVCVCWVCVLQVV